MSISYVKQRVKSRKLPLKRKDPPSRELVATAQQLLLGLLYMFKLQSYPDIAIQNFEVVVRCLFDRWRCSSFATMFFLWMDVSTIYMY